MSLVNRSNWSHNVEGVNVQNVDPMNERLRIVEVNYCLCWFSVWWSFWHAWNLERLVLQRMPSNTWCQALLPISPVKGFLRLFFAAVSAARAKVARRSYEIFGGAAKSWRRCYSSEVPETSTNPKQVQVVLMVSNDCLPDVASTQICVLLCTQLWPWVLVSATISLSQLMGLWLDLGRWFGAQCATVSESGLWTENLWSICF